VTPGAMAIFLSNVLQSLERTLVGVVVTLSVSGGTKVPCVVHGCGVGDAVGTSVGTWVGIVVGTSVGTWVGIVVGTFVGAGVAHT
jgi:hypothetical protein